MVRFKLLAALAAIGVMSTPAVAQMKGSMSNSSMHHGSDSMMMKGPMKEGMDGKHGKMPMHHMGKSKMGMSMCHKMSHSKMMHNKKCRMMMKHHRGMMKHNM